MASRTRRTAQQRARRALECTSGSSALETQSTKPSHGTLSAAQEPTLTSRLHAPTAPVWMLNAKSAQTGPCTREFYHARVDLFVRGALGRPEGENMCSAPTSKPRGMLKCDA